jgi:hypothetical protein
MSSAYIGAIAWNALLRHYLHDEREEEERDRRGEGR